MSVATPPVHRELLGAGTDQSFNPGLAPASIYHASRAVAYRHVSRHGPGFKELSFQEGRRKGNTAGAKRDLVGGHWGWEAYPSLNHLRGEDAISAQPGIKGMDSERVDKSLQA